MSHAADLLAPCGQGTALLVAMTASAMKEDRDQSFAAGMDESQQAGTGERGRGRHKKASARLGYICRRRTTADSTSE